MILQADARQIPLTDGSVHCVVTSPPYWGLRDYKVAGQLGLESTLDDYVAGIVGVFREVWRVLRDDGTLWLNIGDSYAGVGAQTCGTNSKERGRRADRMFKPGIMWASTNLKAKDLVGIPWRLAFALQADGWYLRSDIIWSKPNPMPESVTDRPMKAHEYLFLLAKRERYYFDADAIREPHTAAHLQRQDSVPKDRGDSRGFAKQGLHDFLHPLGRNRRTVWEIATQPYPEAHFATFPEALVEPCVLAGCPEGGRVLDPFAGSGTVGQVCHRLGRHFVGLELSAAYCQLAYTRTAQMGLV